jgi:hypothetical protein
MIQATPSRGMGRRFRCRFSRSVEFATRPISAIKENIAVEEDSSQPGGVEWSLSYAVKNTLSEHEDYTVKQSGYIKHVSVS